MHLCGVILLDNKAEVDNNQGATLKTYTEEQNRKAYLHITSCNQTDWKEKPHFRC